MRDTSNSWLEMPQPVTDPHIRSLSQPFAGQGYFQRDLIWPKYSAAEWQLEH